VVSFDGSPRKAVLLVHCIVPISHAAMTEPYIPSPEIPITEEQVGLNHSSLPLPAYLSLVRVRGIVDALRCHCVRMSKNLSLRLEKFDHSKEEEKIERKKNHLFSTYVIHLLTLI